MLGDGGEEGDEADEAVVLGDVLSSLEEGAARDACCHLAGGGVQLHDALLRLTHTATPSDNLERVRTRA